MDCLKGLDGAGAGVGVPYREFVGDERLDQGFEGGQEGFPRLAPADASQGSQDVDP